MIYAGARAYIGTLFPVTPIEASEVITKVLDTHWGKPLAVALWSAQRDVYESGQRRPYVVAGVFPQRLRVEPLDYPERIRRRLGSSLAGWKKMLAGTDTATPSVSTRSAISSRSTSANSNTSKNCPIDRVGIDQTVYSGGFSPRCSTSCSNKCSSVELSAAAHFFPSSFDRR